MPGFQNVLVGVDFSDCCISALKEAGRIAAWNSAPLVILHVIDPVRIEGIQDYEEISVDEIIARARERLGEIAAKELDPPQNVSTKVVIGHPFEELMRFAAAHPRSLLVLGVHGHREKRRATGSVAAKCARKAPLPVLLVRKDQHRPFAKIVAATDFSENSLAAMRLGAEIAVHDGASFEIVHVHCPPWLQPTSVHYNLAAAPSSDYRIQYNAMLENQLEKAAAELREAHRGLSIATHLLERTHPAYGIIDFVNESGADLTVMGTRGRTGIKSLLLGTTAERLVNDSPCSVLAIKPEGFQFPLE